LFEQPRSETVGGLIEFLVSDVFVAGPQGGFLRVERSAGAKSIPDSHVSVLWT
jgi:hypothetical protein